MSLKTKTVAPSSESAKTKTSTPKSNSSVLKLLKKIKTGNGDHLFDDKTATQLSNIRCVDQSFLLSEDYPDFIYEIIGGFDKLRKMNITDFGIAIQFLTSIAEDENFALENEDFSFIFEGPWYSEESKNYKEYINRLKTKIKIKKGIFKCPACKREGRKDNNTESIELQTRSGDEPLSVHNTCNTCGWKWVI